MHNVPGAAVVAANNFLRRIELSEAPSRRVLNPVVGTTTAARVRGAALIFWSLFDQAKSDWLGS
jgi:hypothetical protein